MNSDPNSEEASPSPEATVSQLFLYAEELKRLHAQERAEREQLQVAQRALAQAQAQQLAIAEDLRRSYEAERQRRRELYESYMTTIKVLATAVEARDDYTGGHVERVRNYTFALAEEMKLDPEVMQRLEVGAVLHDVGKIGVPDSVLRKSGKLTPEEWALMRLHPTLGANLLRNLPMLGAAADILATHHERWDGTGYPMNLKGEAIPIEGRLVAVADAFDAMTTDRSYRPKRSAQVALAEIRSQAGRQFDPGVVNALLNTWNAGTFPFQKEKNLIER